MPPPAANHMTPGRRNKRTGTDNQYFDVGKVGRKTGITLNDTGIRDEHGLEPVSGIFSSPFSAQRQQSIRRIPTSDAMDLQESSIPDIEHTLAMRKTPRLPPARQSTPKHTNIGSPKRSSVKGKLSRPNSHGSPARDLPQPPPNRVLDFTGTTNRNRKSISMVDANSPFKPRKTLRRSNGPARPDPYTIERSPEAGPSARALKYQREASEEGEDVEESIEMQTHPDDAPLMMDDHDDHYEQFDPPQDDRSMGEVTQIVPDRTPPVKRARGRSRKSDQSIIDSQLLPTPSFLGSAKQASGTGSKRDRTSLENGYTSTNGDVSMDATGSSHKRREGRASDGSEIVVLSDIDDQVIDPSLLANGDHSSAEGQEASGEMSIEGDPEQSVQPEKKAKGRPKGKKTQAAPKERDPNRAIRPNSARKSASPSKARRGGSLGPVGNVNLRATTPYDDAGQQTSRYGRNLIQPLQFWNNENRIWEHGEIKGIVRAEPVDARAKQKRKKPKSRKVSRLDGIEEESETESVLPDEWEESVGVISGLVAQWDPETRTGDPANPIQEDLAFAASSIVTRQVMGADFRYAKIMTAPFIGAGLVELPAEGFKKAKNSRKMHMVFFVHAGKVMVEVGATGMEINQFAVSKGGAWVVPRGNNYAITNESTTRGATLFFAQGCVVDGEAE